MHHLFRIKDLGKLKYFFELEICSSKEGLCHISFIFDLLNYSRFFKCKPVTTSMNTDFRPVKGQLLPCTILYKKLICELLYLKNYKTNYSLHDSIIVSIYGLSINRSYDISTSSFPLFERTYRYWLV